MRKAPLVEMKSIHKWYGKVHALKGVNFEVDYNEIVGLVGDNGAGKSTLIKTLCGVYTPDEGEIFFEGRRVKFSSPRDAIEMGIETIHQDTALVNTMDIKRNIFLGREPVCNFGPVKWLSLKEMARNSLAALKKVGLELKSSSVNIDELSGGQRQGIAIARAMYFKTKLLLLDEPTNNLSVKESEKVLQYIQELKKQGTSSVFITHNLYAVYPIADRIAVLRLGENLGEFKKEETSIEELTELLKR